MKRITSINKIERRINEAKPGTIFITADFADIASSDTANRTLQRLAESRLIHRIMRGVYVLPEHSEFLKEYIAPSPDKVANALARNNGWTIVPSGDTALNQLGLSTQVPAIWLYKSDGPYKTYTFNNVILKFKHTANKEISKVSYITALVVQALKALGKEQIDHQEIVKIATTLTAAQKQTILNEAQYTTSWVYNIIKLIADRGNRNESNNKTRSQRS